MGRASTGFVADGYDPSDSWDDAPPRLDVESAGETLTVESYEGRGYGRMTLRQATVLSVNTVYMEMIRHVGPRRVVDLAHAMGVRSDLPAVRSIALGTGSVTPARWRRRSRPSPFAGRVVRRVRPAAGHLGVGGPTDDGLL